MEENNTTANSAATKSNKKMLAFFIVMALLIIGGLAILGRASKEEVSKSDVQDSLTLLESVREKYGQEPSADPSSTEGAREAKAQFTDLLNQWEEANQKLADSNGIKHEEVEQAYNEYAVKFDNSLSKSRELNDSLDAFPVIYDCSPPIEFTTNAAASVESLRSIAKTCLEGVDTVGDVPLTELNSLLSSARDLADKVNDLSDDIEAAVSADNLDEVSNLEEQLLKLITDYQDESISIEDPLGASEYETSLNTLQSTLESVL